MIRRCPPCRDVVPCQPAVLAYVWLFGLYSVAHGWPDDAEERLQYVLSSLAARYGWGIGAAS
jgi:hypothetical protein